MKRIDVMSMGAVGNGIADDYAAIQRALDAGEGGVVVIPDGTYRVPHTLRVHSHTQIEAGAGAHIVHCGSTVKHRGDFLLTNADPDAGNEDISICGGIWDGNFDGVNNSKNPDLFAQDACSGSMLNFINVRGLRLTDMHLTDPVVYFVRMGRVDGFEIRRLHFSSRQLSPNNDGLHFGGGCRNGVVSDITASDGQTNDDMIALNADDSMVRLENLDLTRDDIENIEFSNIYADNCYTVMRLLSVNHAIRNIRMRNIRCGCRVFAINMDGARYCRTPLFTEDEYPQGCGCIENVTIDGLQVWSTEDAKDDCAIICIESRCYGFRLTGFERVAERDCLQDAKHTLLARNLVGARICVDGREYDMKEKSDTLALEGTFSELTIDQRAAENA